MTGSKAMKTVVITGGSRGFGFEMAKVFVHRGFNVVISAVNEQRINEAVEALSKEAKDNKVAGFSCNIRNAQEIQSLWDETVSIFGNVDIWINNAGVNCADKPTAEMTENEISFVIDTDLKGTMNGSRIAFKGMQEQGFGKIYNVEGFGSDDSVRMGLTLYGTAKRAVTYFTHSLANESKKLTGGKIKIGSLTPGIMITEFLTTANNEKGSVVLSESAKKFYNIAADYPDVIAEYCVPKIIANEDNDANVIWLTKTRLMGKFFKACFKKNDFFKDSSI